MGAAKEAMGGGEAPPHDPAEAEARVREAEAKEGRAVGNGRTTYQVVHTFMRPALVGKLPTSCPRVARKLAKSCPNVVRLLPKSGPET